LSARFARWGLERLGTYLATELRVILKTPLVMLKAVGR